MRVLILISALFFGWSLAAQPVPEPVSPEPGLNERVESLEREMRALKESSQTSPAAEPPAAPAPSSPTPLPASPALAPVPASDPAPKTLLQLTEAGPSVTGLSPAVSKIYNPSAPPLVFGLTSEFFTFKRQGGAANVNRTSVLSLAPAFGARLTPRLLFNAQFEFENGGAESSNTVTLQKGQSIVRMAYADWLASEDGRSGVRLGHQLVPVGVVNTAADPTAYFGVQRPELERELIPSLWHENGASFWIDRPRAEVQAGVFSSLDAAGFRQDTFLGGGRGQGQNSASDDWMGVIRIQARREFFTAGASTAFGNSAQRSTTLRTGAFQLGEAHLQLHTRRFQTQIMVAQGEIQDADAISVTNSTVMGEQAKGYSAHAAFDILGASQKLWIFLRHSKYNLHDRVPDLYVPDPSLNKTRTTLGASFIPLQGFVLKMDYQWKRSAAGDEEDEFNLGAGLVF